FWIFQYFDEYLLLLGVDKVDSEGVEVITIDSDTDDAPCPVKEEFVNGDGLDSTLSEVLDGIESGNLNSNACPVCEVNGPPGPNSAHKCAECHVPVHSFGCSVQNPNGVEGYGGNDRVCLPCSRKVKPTKTNRYNPSWKCHTCGNKDIVLKTIKTPGPCLGWEYYGCFASSCTKDKPFLFWAPKDKSSEKIVSPGKRINVTQRKQKGPKRSYSEPLSHGEITGTEQPMKRTRPMRQIQLPLKIRRSYVFETP
ncbi:uncharacterized protein LOC113214292, partial [Frankliniella occidentalis]|uniref:Uncharacterized protein LOC113214292 n=1 Tax=Frankliniella occidentalis TaxID=133901 RepID=A0A9C6XVC0_FRAOC